MFVLDEVLQGIGGLSVIDQALNGEQAIEKIMEKLESEGKTYDMVLIDLNMPLMDGPETMK